MRASVSTHWPEYLMEAAALGLFMIAAIGFTVLLEHPSSPVRAGLSDPLARRGLMGLAMGLTAVGLIYSPWGKRSGAHMNPAVTLAFLGLGRVAPRDAMFYVLSQFAGGLLGVLLVRAALGAPVADPAVNYAVTVPGPAGVLPAFLAETLISLVLMLVVLRVSDSRRARFTGLAAGALVALWITFEAPLSGMSMNPARTLASALPAMDGRGLWVYFLAPPLGMLAAARLHGALRGAHAGACAKLHHDNPYRCIFCGP